MTASSSDAHERLLELSEQACNGTLSAEDYIQLDALLSSSHRNQLLYLEYVHLYSELESLAVGAAGRPAPRVSGRPRSRGLAGKVGLGVAVCLLSALTLLGLSLRTSKSPEVEPEVARAKETLPPWLARVHRNSSGAVWKVDGHGQGSHIFPRQPLVIGEGCLELDFRNGTKLSAEGPAELVIHDDLRVALLSGTVRATLAEGVSGFQIETSTMEIVDRGTQFYVQLDPEGMTTSYVSQGVCDIRNRADESSQTPFRKLGVGECVLVDHERKLVALSAEQSRKFSERIVSRFLSYDLPIQQTSPSVCLISAPEGMLDHQFSSANRPVYLIPERRNVLLRSDLVVRGRDGAAPVTIPAGTVIDSYLVHHAFGPDLPGDASDKLLKQTRTAGAIVFQNEILAVASEQDQLAQTDKEFAARGVRFPQQNARAVEARDRVSVSPADPNRLEFEFQATEGDVDHVRVLVRSADAPL